MTLDPHKRFRCHIGRIQMVKLTITTDSGKNISVDITDDVLLEFDAQGIDALKECASAISKEVIQVIKNDRATTGVK